MEDKSMKFYDENSKEVKPYSEEEFKQVQQNWKKQPFEAKSFSNNIWIGYGVYGDTFYNPGSILLYSDDDYPNGITINAYYDGDQLKHSVDIPAGVGDGTNVPFTVLERGKSYSFELVNNSPGVASYTGEVWYDG